MVSMLFNFLYIPYGTPNPILPLYVTYSIHMDATLYRAISTFLLYTPICCYTWLYRFNLYTVL